MSGESSSNERVEVDNNCAAGSSSNGLPNDQRDKRSVPPPIKPRISLQRKRLEREALLKQQQQEEFSKRTANKCGFLYKTDPSRKRFQKRWFIICDALISYFSEEPTRSSRVEPKGTIPFKDVMFVGECTVIDKAKHPPTRSRSFSSKTPHQTRTDCKTSISHDISQYQSYFNVGVSSQQGRIYLFAAESPKSRQEWIKILAERIAPPKCYLLSNLTRIECCGYLHVKLGISGIWTTCFVVLSGKNVTILTEFYEDVHRENKIVHVDLRKVLSPSLTTAHQISSCGTVSEIGQPISLNRPYDTTIYIQGVFKSHTESWYHLFLNAWTVPPNALLDQQLLTPSNIPVAVDKCLNFISTYGGLKTKGIYKNSGDETAVKSIFSNLRDTTKLWEWHIRPEEGYTVIDVASALKLYLSSFPECILTEKLYSEFIENNQHENRDERLRRIKCLLKRLPLINFNTLKKIICHFCYLIENADQNQMNIGNISLTMGPVLLFSSQTETDDGCRMDVIGDLITCYAWLFDVTQEEMEKERKIQRTLVCLRETRIRSSKPAGDILVGVYVYNSEWGKCINVPLTPTMSAEELVIYIKEKCNLKEPVNRLSVFEVVCDNQLERILHYSEVVLGVTLSWTTNWPADDAKSNYLIVKTNDLYDKLSPFLNQTNCRTSTIPLSLFSELKFSDINGGKTFRKVICEFIGARLNIYKDAKADKVIGQWNIEDIVWYLGSEAKRNAPSKFCITFINRDKPIIRNKESSGFIGRTICCNTEQEYYQWISGMIIAEYPNGVYPPVKTFVDLLS
ncbi:arf-GAP with Rho-GAP domain: ANK repeat and PH domain-containing protein 1-like protein [Dinothrombium tinctorium]|uniref:Arf-GAP with Rho-GAP domain: ANK repeat and PH domain-containing protein 1-like protein n=1 Tax=Dinothrombium tinctorium TaxID=1965070 RepID=A0A3S3QMQ1_9ACAR|nr:arf-GAP with Rho-GAP domain: ANK repeat and PH domain-containing protein 1-like protein [Dinothrombium tinctorium]